MNSYEREQAAGCYQHLPTSWVVQGIALPSEDGVFDPVREYLLPRSHYSELDVLLESEPDSELPEDNEEIGHPHTLEGLSEQQKAFVKTYAQAMNLLDAAKSADIDFSKAKEFYEKIRSDMRSAANERDRETL